MSLINEALRKARLEAARQESTEAGIPLPAVADSRGGPTGLGVLLVGGVLGLMAIGGALFWLGQRSAGGHPVVAIAETGAGGGSGPTANARPETGPAPTAVPTGMLDREETSPTSTEPVPPQADVAKTAPNPGTTAPRPEPMATRAEPASRPAQPENRAAPAAERPPPLPASTTTGNGVRAPATPVTPAVSEPVPPTPRAPATADAQVSNPEPSPPDAESATGSAEPATTFVGEATIPGAGTLKLGGIAWSPVRPFALINGRVVGPGDTVRSLLITEVERRHVVLRNVDGEFFVLKIE